MENGLTSLSGGSLWANNPQQPENTETDTEASATASETNSDNETQSTSENTQTDKTTASQETTDTPRNATVEPYTSATTQSAVLAHLLTTPIQQSGESEISNELAESLARAGADKAISEARQMMVVDLIKSPSLGGGQVTELTQNKQTPKASNPYSVAETEAA